MRLAPSKLPGILLLVYCLTGLLGTLALKLPFSTIEPISWTHAFFTSVSALTVTGLSVFDIGTSLTFWGQAVILLLIQLGGLGIITFTCLLLSALHFRQGLAQQQFLRAEIGVKGLKDLKIIVKHIALFFVVFESVGAAILMVTFIPEQGSSGIWSAIFHSISAFNNAGFSLNATSLQAYAEQPLVSIPITLQIIVGGLGFIALSDMLTKRKWKHYRTHTQLMLIGTGSLLLIAWIGFASLEWNNQETLGQYPFLTKLNVSWFEAVTPRTAGFNIVDYSLIEDETTVLTVVLMLIGGGSASTAGGFKVTSAFVLLLVTMSFFKGRAHTHVLGRSIGQNIMLKVMALFTVSTLLIFVFLFLILATHDIEFLDAFFEIVSAFGTVGLSRGATGELNNFGLALISIAMLLGRVGPLSFGFLLASKAISRVKYPVGDVYLG